MIQELIDKYNAKIDTPELATKALNQGFWFIIASAMISVVFFEMLRDSDLLGEAILTAAFGFIILKTQNRPVTLFFLALSLIAMLNDGIDLGNQPRASQDACSVLVFLNDVLCLTGASRVLVAIYRAKSLAEA